MSDQTNHTNPFAPDMKIFPYTRYEQWRKDGPVMWSPEARAWMILDYDTCREVLRDHTTFSSGNSLIGGPKMPHHKVFPSVFLLDEPRHSELRGLVSKAFHAETINKEWKGRIDEVTDDLMEKLKGQNPINMIEALSGPLPVTIICDIIGVQEDATQLKQWSDKFADALGDLKLLDPLYNIEDVRERTATYFGSLPQEIGMFFMSQVQDRRTNPRNDLITKLTKATEGERSLSDWEIAVFCGTLFFAGNETTTNLITTGIRALTEEAGILRTVYEHPEKIDDLVEEALRWDGPVQGLYRRAKQDVVLSGKQIKKDDALVILYASANRDSQKYGCPAHFDLDRDNKDHLAFGKGIHYCLGAKLAKEEAKSALSAVVQTFETMRLVEEPIWSPAPCFRGPRKYVVEATPRT